MTRVRSRLLELERAVPQFLLSGGAYPLHSTEQIEYSGYAALNATWCRIRLIASTIVDWWTSLGSFVLTKNALRGACCKQIDNI